jgi:hypothetical protein
MGLPLLERAPQLLPEQGLDLGRHYVQLCHELGDEPDASLLASMYSALVAGGVITPDD